MVMIIVNDDDCHRYFDCLPDDQDLIMIVFLIIKRIVFLIIIIAI